VAQLERVGIRAQVESETTGFTFDDFASAWDVLAGVTAAQRPSERQEEAKAALQRCGQQGTDRAISPI
jgi:hypothetical protein